MKNFSIGPMCLKKSLAFKNVNIFLVEESKINIQENNLASLPRTFKNAYKGKENKER